jgi:hypothetical protein
MSSVVFGLGLPPHLNVRRSAANAFIQIPNAFEKHAPKVDAFFPRMRLAVQIDDQGHTGYDQVNEKEIDPVLRDHNIVCLRFNPDCSSVIDASSELTRLVWERSLSTDFTASRTTPVNFNRLWHKDTLIYI